jgi:outer membrane lipoprotein-sorting protein
MLIRQTLCAALLLFALPAGAETLADVKASLKATTTMTARFAQTAADGRQQFGRLILARPGKIRFEYTKAPILIVADGSRLTFVDYEVAQVSQWPIRSTPLGVLLDADADLARFARVTSSTATLVQVEARDPKHPEYGAITLGFRPDAAAPGGLALIGWTSLDAQNNLTDVRLDDVRYNVPVSKVSFTFRDPRSHAAPGKTS